MKRTRAERNAAWVAWAAGPQPKAEPQPEPKPKRTRRTKP